MTKVLYAILAISFCGCASCPFTDTKGHKIDNSQWVGFNWQIWRGGWFHGSPLLRCNEARALGHPEWHRMPERIVEALINSGNLDKPNRYAPGDEFAIGTSTSSIPAHMYWDQKTNSYKKNSLF